ncbi:hypothetical protein [Nocardia jiangsuensis]|uniref:Uncharacterized protein n=1 Tax=Nocardia jiangsuensis TaxID=1691563 RepID=A0ABV8DQW7_9NOCA
MSSAKVSRSGAGGEVARGEVEHGGAVGEQVVGGEVGADLGVQVHARRVALEGGGEHVGDATGFAVVGGDPKALPVTRIGEAVPSTSGAERDSSSRAGLAGLWCAAADITFLPDCSSSRERRTSAPAARVRPG